MRCFVLYLLGGHKQWENWNAYPGGKFPRTSGWQQADKGTSGWQQADKGTSDKSDFKKWCPWGKKCSFGKKCKFWH